MHINIAWQDVDTVLLDMDGTLLDLASIIISGKSWCLKHGARKTGLRHRKRWNICASNITTYSIR